eukprot:3626-Heterococcus_DN1.PRE.1
MIVDTLFCTCALLCLALRSQVTQLQQQIDQLTQANASMVQERDGARDEATQATATLAERDAELAAAKDFNGTLSDQLDTCARHSAEKDEVVLALQGHTAELQASLEEIKANAAAVAAASTATIKKLQEQLATVDKHHQRGLEAFDAVIEAAAAARKRYLSTSTLSQAGGSSSKRQRVNVTDEPSGGSASGISSTSNTAQTDDTAATTAADADAASVVPVTAAPCTSTDTSQSDTTPTATTDATVASISTTGGTSTAVQAEFAPGVRGAQPAVAQPRQKKRKGKGKAKANNATAATAAITSSDENTDVDDINDDEPTAITVVSRPSRAAKTKLSPGGGIKNVGNVSDDNDVDYNKDSDNSTSSDESDDDDDGNNDDAAADSDDNSEAEQSSKNYALPATGKRKRSSNRVVLTPGDKAARAKVARELAKAYIEKLKSQRPGDALLRERSEPKQHQLQTHAEEWCDSVNEECECGGEQCGSKFMHVLSNIRATPSDDLKSRVLAQKLDRHLRNIRRSWPDDSAHWHQDSPTCDLANMPKELLPL